MADFLCKQELCGGFLSYMVLKGDSRLRTSITLFHCVPLYTMGQERAILVYEISKSFDF